MSALWLAAFVDNQVARFATQRTGDPVESFKVNACGSVRAESVDSREAHTGLPRKLALAHLLREKFPDPKPRYHTTTKLIRTETWRNCVITHLLDRSITHVAYFGVSDINPTPKGGE